MNESFRLIVNGPDLMRLSRDVPAGLGWLIKGFLTKMPRDSMMMTLKKTREALEQ